MGISVFVGANKRRKHMKSCTRGSLVKFADEILLWVSVHAGPVWPVASLRI